MLVKKHDVRSILAFGCEPWPLILRKEEFFASATVAVAIRYHRKMSLPNCYRRFCELVLVMAGRPHVPRRSGATRGDHSTFAPR